MKKIDAIKNIDGLLVKDSPVASQHTTVEKRSLFQKIFQYIFSMVQSKLAASPTTSESSRFKVSEDHRSQPESSRETYLDACFTDRVDPSIYYTLFFPNPLPGEAYQEREKFSDDEDFKKFYR